MTSGTDPREVNEGASEARHPLVLVIEDEPQIRCFMRAALTAEGFRLCEATTGEDGLAEAAMRQPDIVILDLGLPDIEGLEVLARLREWTAIPVIVVSARGQEQDKITALDAGADDYVSKPFSIGELIARLRVALRHQARSERSEPTFTVGDLTVDFAEHRVTKSGQEIHLTPIEFKLLTTLVRHAGKVLTHRHVIGEVWGDASPPQSTHLRVYMSMLRKKIEDDPAQPRYVLTEPGVGYRFAAE